SAFMIFGTPMRALVPVVGSACRSSASCWGTPRRRQLNVTRISMPILYVARRRRLVAALQPHYLATELDQWFSCKLVVIVERWEQADVSLAGQNDCSASRGILMIFDTRGHSATAWDDSLMPAR